MKLCFWMIGKTQKKHLEEGIGIFTDRIGRYVPFESEILPEGKSGKKTRPEQVMKQEAEAVLRRLDPADHLILLDAGGRQFDSLGFADYVEHLLHYSSKRIVFLVGGAFGFDPALRQRADARLSLSTLTFSHQLIRLIFLEQLYRAFTIIRNEPYHNE